MRRFTLLSLAGILVVALLITGLYRQVAVSAIVEFGERNNLMVAQSALIPIKPELMSYLQEVADLPAERIRTHPISERIRDILLDMMEHTTVVRVKVYTRQGLVAYSTIAAQVGDDQSRNSGVMAALAGRVASELIYRDAFNAFDQQTEEDNLIQTYIPVRSTGADAPRGAFEIYTDVNQMVNQVQHAEVVVLGGSVLALTLLYGVLLLIVRRGASIIQQQQHTIGERTRTLERLSVQMLSGQEAEKKRLAHRLHEGVSQNLAAIKLLAEQELAGSGDARGTQLVDLIHETMADVTGLAVRLHPPSLDDFGLVTTLTSLPRTYGSRYPHLRLKTRILVKEAEIPESLRTTLYYIAQESVDAVGREGSARHAELSLLSDGATIELSLADDGPAYHAAGDDARNESPRWAAAQERTVLSGGRFSVASDHRGGTVCRATWDVVAETE